MELLNLILVILVVLIIFSIVFRVLWFLAPFIIIAMGILYLRNRLSMKSNQTKSYHQSQTKNNTSTDRNADVVDVEFKVRDSDED